MNKVKVFIAHAPEDHGFAFKLAEKMQKDLGGLVEIFVDDWIRKISNALEKADFFILVLSLNSIEKHWDETKLQAVIDLLIREKTTILPIWLEIGENDVPPMIRPIKAAVFTSTIYIDEHEYEKLLTPIKDKIKADELLKFQDRFLENIKHIDIIAKRKEPTKQEIEFVLNLIKNNPSYGRYIFQKLTSRVWFEIFKSEGFFSPEKVPGPEPADEKGYFRIPYWPPLDYLKKISEQIKEGKITGEEKIKYANELLEIIKDVSNYTDKQGNHIDNYLVWDSFVEILCNLPKELITLEIIDLIPVWLDSRFSNDLQASRIIEDLLPKFLTDNRKDIKKVERIIEHITAVKTVKHEGKEERVLVVEAYYLEKMFRKYSSIIGEKCSVNVIKNLAEKIKYLLTDKIQGTLESFYTEEYSIIDNVDLLSYGLRKIMLAKARKEAMSLEPVLEEFLKDENFIFTKITLFIIAENMDNFKDFFWKIINTNIGVKIFKETLYWGDELRHVLENLGTLNDKEREILEEKIKTACKELKKELTKAIKTQKEAEKLIALHKQKIYKALSYDKHFKNLYEEMKELTKTDSELGPAVKVKVITGWGKSPLSEHEILEMPNEELAKYLSEFKTENFWEGPTVEALAETLSTAARIKPEKFTYDLKPFINTSYLYISKLLEGLEKAVKDNKPIDWDKVLDFVLDYINRKEFWENKLIMETETPLKSTCEWVIMSFSSLIITGIESKVSSIFQEYFGKVEKILLLILDKIKYEEDKEVRNKDYVSYSLNTPLGQVLEAYIRLVLENTRTIGIAHQWKRLKEKLQEFLEKKVVEACTWFGFYLVDFYSLDEKWCREKIDFFKNLKHTPHWEAFMNGYLFRGVVNKSIYESMKEHYKLGINYDFKNKETIRNLIAHISLAYLHGHENLFNEIVEEFKLRYIKEIINFFWHQKENIKDIDKILDFWRRVYKKLKDKQKNNLLTDSDEIILSELSKLAVFLPSINKEYKDWLLLSAPYVEKNYNASFFIRYLNELKDRGDTKETAKYIGEIFLRMIEGCDEKKPPPMYPSECIKSIVEFLCRVPESRKDAREICNLYLRIMTTDFLKEICEKCEGEDM